MLDSIVLEFQYALKNSLASCFVKYEQNVILNQQKHLKKGTDLYLTAQ